MCSKWSKSVKYCVRDQCQGYEPGVLSRWVLNCLLRVILEILVKCSVAITVLIVLSVVSINTVICLTQGLSVIIYKSVTFLFLLFPFSHCRHNTEHSKLLRNLLLFLSIFTAAIYGFNSYGLGYLQTWYQCQMCDCMCFTWPSHFNVSPVPVSLKIMKWASFSTTTPLNCVGIPTRRVPT